ncbi:DUF3592 domain-containing protein [Streptomyces sp. ISL-98]|uniref:DUF3592 domain-containing protein n=1 Tax=Streptomyces sp. ISL-98 TaxID=2819192 RepID=UPI001BED27F6|nr:DUF3592 domain-containing protein [Streptomyces sp. ISL-98]MBT2511825.1 DUF3592 domain-containing protein [Streptomyces sp. ISL-98]
MVVTSGSNPVGLVSTSARNSGGRQAATADPLATDTPHARVAQHMEREWLFSLIPLTIGAVFLSFGVYGLRRASAIRRTGVTAEGRIVRHDVSRGDEGARFHHPVAAWTTRDGRECEYSSRFGRGVVGSGFGVGTVVMVHYDPEDPRRFAIQGWDAATVDLVFTVLGSLLTAGTLVVLLVLLLTL